MTVELSDEELREVLALLNTQAGDMYTEIRRTHNPDAHEGLKERRHFVMGIIDKLDRARLGLAPSL
jgi:hypothetical protein